MTVLRPLLDIAPEALRDYLNAANIRWVEDESNQCDDYLRVRVRKLLPQLAEVLGLSEERIVDTMATLRRSKAYLDEQTERIVKIRFNISATTLSRCQRVNFLSCIRKCAFG